MNRPFFAFALTAALGAIVVTASTSSAQPPRPGQPGQPPVQLAPPVPGKPGNPPAIMSLLGTIALVGGVVGAAMIPPKRGHQD